MSRKIIINYLLIFIIFTSFILGLNYSENSSGGASVDFPKIFNNAKIFFSNNLTSIPWEDYNSSSLPLYYIVLDLFFSELTKEKLIITNLFFTFLSILFLFLIFQKKIKKINKSYLLLFSSILMLSPYVRSSTFWGLEEIIGVLMLIITFYCLINYEYNKKIIFLIFVVLFSSLAFYTRQSYLFLVMYTFFQIYDFKNFFSFKNIFIVVLYLFLLLPSLFFFYEWGGLIPPIAVKMDRGLSLHLYNLPLIFSILVIYILPFVYLSSKNLNQFFDLFKKNIFKLIFLNGIFFFILFNFTFQTVGSGFFVKVIQYLNINFYISILILSFVSSFSAILILNYFNKKTLICLSYLIIIFLSINLIFQEYFDPITFIIISALYNYQNIELQKIQNFIIISFFYYSFFLMGANFYYNFL